MHIDVGVTLELRAPGDKRGASVLNPKPAFTQRVLERRAGSAERFPELLRQRPGHEAAKDVAHDQRSLFTYVRSHDQAIKSV